MTWLLQRLETLTPLAFVFPGAVVVILIWNTVMAGWISRRREAPRVFTQITAICGLLIAPALVVAIASGTEAGVRTVADIGWLLPLVTCAFVVQVAYTVATRLVSPVVAIPLLLYNVVVAAVSIGDFLVAQRGSAPLGLQAAVAARDAVMGMTVGRATLVSPVALLVPLIAPAYPARWRLSGAVRAVLVLGATALTTLVLLEWPRGIGAIRSYAAARNAPMQARPAGDFVLGLRLFNVIDGPPLARVVTKDRLLVEQFEPDIVLLVLDDDGTRTSALDSLARVLEPLRTDSVRIAVALRVGRNVPAADDPERLAATERVLRRIRPDVFFPAYRDPLPPLFAGDAPTVQWWQTLLRLHAGEVERVRPRTMLAWAASRLDTTDSAVYAWGATAGSPVELLGAVVFPSFSGLPAVDARLRALDRWHGLAVQRGGGTVPHWLAAIGGLPHAHGDVAQLAAIRRALAWGSRRSWINAAIIAEPADYSVRVGLRASDGRERLSVSVLSQTARRMREIRDTPRSASPR